MGLYCIKKKLTDPATTTPNQTLEDGLDILNLYLKDRGELSLKALSSLLATEVNVNVYQAKDILDYVWQYYNRYRYYPTEKKSEFNNRKRRKDNAE